GVKGSRPGSDEAVVGELTTGAAGAETGTRGLGDVGLCAVVEQAAQYIAIAARQAGAQTPRLRVGSIYTPTNTSITMYINILLDFQSIGPARTGGKGVDDLDTPARTAPTEPAFCHVGRRQRVA
ncbi:MAG: hypothetical protein WA825_10120, partial [Steroidobacteraceae bacterium]